MEFLDFKGQFLYNYYRAHDSESGALPLEPASRYIAIGIGSETYAPLVKQQLLKATKPEDFFDSCIALSAEVIDGGGIISVNTVGDPDHQQAKLELGRFRDRIAERLADLTQIETYYSEHIYSCYKKVGIRSELERFEREGITDAYVGDDNRDIINFVQQISSEFARRQSSMAIHDFLIKPNQEDPDAWGASTDDFVLYVRTARNLLLESKAAFRLGIVYDVDETIMRTSVQLERAAATTYQAVNDTYKVNI